MKTLSEHTLSTVESTTPILRERGTEICERFYHRLFTEYPDVVPMFPGDPKEQAERLARAVLAYASNIRNATVLVPTIERIAARHVEAGVQPAQYDVVGELLLGSMVEVLGEIDVVVLDAWAEAYGALADVFIATESELAAAG